MALFFTVTLNPNSCHLCCSYFRVSSACILLCPFDPLSIYFPNFLKYVDIVSPSPSLPSPLPSLFWVYPFLCLYCLEYVTEKEGSQDILSVCNFLKLQFLLPPVIEVTCFHSNPTIIKFAGGFLPA